MPPAAGVNASTSDMAQWLLAQSGHRPDVLPAPLLATLHAPLVATPGEMRGSSWRRERLYSASYALGWRVYDYAGHQLVFHGGAVQGYRGVIALLPERDLGIAILWNSESSLPSGLLPTILDRAIGLPTAPGWTSSSTTRRCSRRRHIGRAQSDTRRRRHDHHQGHGLAAVIIRKPADQNSLYFRPVPVPQDPVLRN